MFWLITSIGTHEKVFRVHAAVVGFSTSAALVAYYIIRSEFKSQSFNLKFKIISYVSPELQLDVVNMMFPVPVSSSG